jgi:hypothetical protein
MARVYGRRLACSIRRIAYFCPRWRTLDRMIITAVRATKL